MSEDRIRTRPAQAYCQRCKNLFCYFRRTTHRVYCGGCVELERLDLFAFTKVQRQKQTAANAQRRTVLLIQRLTGVAAHA